MKGDKTTGYIYQYTLLCEGSDKGKMYIGATTDPIKRKYTFNSKSRYAGKKIDEARMKYGTDGKTWKYEIVETVTVGPGGNLWAVLKKQERFWIAKMDSVSSGFNSSKGDGMSGLHQSEETKKKIGDKNRGQKRTPEQIENLRNGQVKKMVGVMVVYNDGSEVRFDSEIEASRHLGVNVGTINHYLTTGNEFKSKGLWIKRAA